MILCSAQDSFNFDADPHWKKMDPDLNPDSDPDSGHFFIY